MRVAVVGAGPAGAQAARELALGGARVVLFDPSHPREKPCGGGLTGRALAQLPEPPAGDPLPAREVGSCRFESGQGEAVEVPLRRPVAIASRRELDSWLVRRAVEAGAAFRPERVLEVGGDGRLRTAAGETRFDVVVGADGTESVVRRRFLGPAPAARLTMSVGWRVRAEAPMLVRFLPGLEGYLWLFPRRDHVSAGACAPLGAVPTRDLWCRLEAEAVGLLPAAAPRQAYARVIASPSTDPRCLAEVAGERWALVGDAAALADPITGEGLFQALLSGRLLARTLLAGRDPRDYAEALLEGPGRELLRSAALRRRFYAPGFTRRMVRYAERSRAVREVLADLVLGEQGYAGLEGRLLRALPSLVAGSAIVAARARLGRPPGPGHATR